MIGRVARTAIDDAGIAPGDVEASFVSLFNNGFSAQDFPASLVLQHVPELRFRPITRTRTRVHRDPPRCTVRATLLRRGGVGSCW